MSPKPKPAATEKSKRAVEIASRVCKCTHGLGEHHNGECLAVTKGFRFCVCKSYRPKDSK